MNGSTETARQFLKPLLVAIAATLATGFSTSRQTALGPPAPMLLQGVHAMMVTVEIDRSTAYADAAALKALVETKLKNANINVVPTSDTELHLALHLGEYQGVIYYAITTSVNRPAVILNGSEATRAIVLVSDDVSFGTVGRGNAADALASNISTLVDKFLSGFTRLNARYSGPPVVDSADARPRAADALRALKTVRVESLDPGAKALVENRLKGAGIAVSPDSAYTLNVVVDTTDSDLLDTRMYVVTLRLQAMVRATWNGRPVTVIGPIWGTSLLSAFKRPVADPSDDIGLGVEAFLEDFRKVHSGTSGPGNSPVAPAVSGPVTGEVLTEACIASWRSTVLPNRPYESTQSVMLEGSNWCRCLAPRFANLGLSKEQMDALLGDFVSEQSRIRETSSDQSLRKACFNR